MIQINNDEKQIYVKGSAVEILTEATDLYINIVVGVLKNLKDQKARNDFLRMIGDSFIAIMREIKKFEDKEKGSADHGLMA